MKAQKFMDALGKVDDRYIQEAVEYKKERKAFGAAGTKWCAAACLALFFGVGGYVIYQNVEISAEITPVETDSPEVLPELAMLPAALPQGEGMGFEGIMLYDISESGSGNPWNEELQIEKLPVYKNLAYTDVPGLPVYLSREELMNIAENVAAAMGEQISETDYDTAPDITFSPESAGEEMYALSAVLDNMKIRVEGNGCVRVELTVPFKLPGDYGGTDGKVSDEEAEDVIRYLSEVYAPLLNFDNPAADTWADYTYLGEQTRRYGVYNNADDDIQNILNYNFNGVSFSIRQNELRYIHIENRLSAAQKLGDYPIITAKEAREYLLKGEYLTTVPEEYLSAEGIRKEDIAKTELVYRTGNTCEVYMPYYRFYVELPETFEIGMADGLKMYGIYYVPAVNGKYLLDFPAEIRFN